MKVSAILNLFRPAPYPEPLSDPAQVETEYRYWRLRIFYSMYFGYTFYYFTRKSFSFITPFLTTQLGLTTANVGILVSLLSVSYGISKFTSGILCDRSNPRYFMAIGLILTGLCNILFGLSSSFICLAIVWCINGWFQGWGWPACTKQLTHWYSRSERGTWWSACATSHTVGGYLIAYIAAYPADWFGWRFGMLVPGALCIVAGLWLLDRLRDVPQSLGLPCIEKFKGEEKIIDQAEIIRMPIKKILFEQVLNNRYIWILALSYFFVYIVRTAVGDLGPLYLMKAKGYSPIDASKCVAYFEVGGLLGILAAGWGSDYWFDGRRIPVIVLSSLLLIFSVLGLWYLLPNQVLLASLLVAVIGFLVFCPQMLVGLAAAECVSKQAASTSNGFVGCFASLGGAVAGYPLSKIADVFGWYSFIITLMISSVATLLVLLPIWSLKSTPKAASMEPSVA